MSSTRPPIVFPTQSTIKCDGCDSEFDVNWFCKNCPASLCNGCKDHHATERLLNKHNVVPRTGDVIRMFDSSNVKERCSEHTEREIILYCNDCDVPCCDMCTENHVRHFLEPIVRKYQVCEDKLNEIVSYRENNTLKSLHNTIETLQQVFHSYKIDVEAVVEEIRNFGTSLKDTVDTACGTFVAEIRHNVEMQGNKIDSEIKSLETQIQENISFISDCKGKIKQGGIALLQYKPDPPKVEVNPLPDLSKNKPSFIPKVDLLHSISHDVGEIKWETSNGDMENVAKDELVESFEKTKMASGIMEATAVTNTGKLTERTSEPDANSGKPQVMPLRIDLRFVTSYHTDVSIAAVIPVGNDTAWITQADYMYLFDTNGNKIQSFRLKKKKEILDIALRPNDFLVSHSDQKVSVVSLNGELREFFDAAPFFPKRLCFTKNGEIVVCMVGPHDKKDKNHVAVYSFDGKTKINEYGITDERGSQMLIDPTRVVEVDGKYFAILNNKYNVILVDHSGKIKWEYSGSRVGQGVKAKYIPQGLCVDSFGHLFISDRANGCIHCVDKEGKLIKRLTPQENLGVKWPCGI